jgi:hypothetical protein
MSAGRAQSAGTGKVRYVEREGIIWADWRPCYRCSLGRESCVTCKHPRRAIGPVAQRLVAEANSLSDSFLAGDITQAAAIKRLKQMLAAVRSARPI